MSSILGTRLGVYDVTAPIGEGGMGQVYRARDTRLDRDVAIKILSEAFAQDADRLARFQREARTLASLNHPHIAGIYGLEESSGVSALVMELVEGEDLQQRIARGAIPIDEVLPIAKQIADAFEAAHEQGIVHRDLKPANIKVRADGTVKVLDFGLATAIEPRLDSSSGLSMPPTMTSPAMTQAGMILGTAAYMSPEQARGKTVDKRADIWAFGCVLHEMLTGEQLFRGDSVPETLGLIFSREPDLATLPAATPARVRTLIARCLVKDPRHRLRDIGEARLALDAAPDPPVAVQPISVPWRWVPWGIAVLMALVAGWALMNRAGSTPGATAALVTHFDVSFPRDIEPAPATSLPPSLSPDGRILATVGVKDGVRYTLFRRLDQPQATEIPDTVGANGAVFSPDGQHLAVLSSSGQLFRVSLADQQRKLLASGVELPGSLTWGEPGIVFTRGGALWFVSPDGGEPRSLTVLDSARHEVLHNSPLFLPGGRLIVFTSQANELGTERIESIPVDGGARSVVVDGARSPVWSPTGHLLFARDDRVFAIPFDSHSGLPQGTAISVIPADAIEALSSGQLALSLSLTGTLLFAPAGFTDTRLVSVARDGTARTLDLPAGRYANPRVSPDGRRLLIESGGSIIEALDLARGTRARLTAAALGTLFSTWNADGSRVVFRRFNTPFWAAGNGTGVTGFVPGGAVSDFPTSAGPDPDSFVAVRIAPETSSDIFLMSISGAFAPKPLIVTPAYEGGAQLSPDGRWLLYQSDASGRAAIYVRRYPELDRQWQVSDGGGIQARWSRDMREIYYRKGREMVAAAFTGSGAEPVFGKPTTLFTDEYDFGAGASIANYDVTADGRFLMIRRGSNGGRLRVVVNWTEELKRILATGGVH